jgi:hypothetical protein
MDTAPSDVVPLDVIPSCNNYWAMPRCPCRVTSSTFLLARLLGAACQNPPATDHTRADSPAPALPFVGRTWVSTDLAAAAGTLRIFLPDGTLVMDSCVETYRLARWRALDERRLEWHEDTARIEAEVADVGADHLRLRLHLVGELKDEHYRLAPVPFVCPDVRPSPVTTMQKD